MTTQTLGSSAAAWPLARRLTWVLLLGLTLFEYGPAIAGSLAPPEHMITDLFQEWASAKNYLNGQKLYRPHRETAWEYMQYRHDPKQRGVFVEINGHPPTAVLMCMPFVLLEYRTACVVWNVLSLAALVGALYLIVPEFLGRKFSWAWIVLLTLVLSNPLLQHLRMSQWGTFLLLLIAIAYRADQRGNSRLAGAMIGTAAAFKLFPAFLFLYFFMKRDWRAVTSGIVVFAAWNLASLGLFGFDDFHDYVTDSLPELNKYRSSWANSSIVGFWFRMFAASKEGHPLWDSPATAQALSLLSQLGVVTLVMWMLRRAPREHRSEDFALTVAAMIVLSPIVWDHYMLLFLLPGLMVARWLPSAVIPQAMFRISLLVMWVNPLLLWLICTLNKTNEEVGPLDFLLVISWPSYAVAMMFGLTATMAWVRKPAVAPVMEAAASSTAPQSRTWIAHPASVEWSHQDETTTVSQS